ncbi:hypothetical protein [Nakamurella multipartita]|uniref:Uncharacterized protein n=1 Tax=Nakamurella multipartita (strain ATCC 700099 / DSM 44233 / CIP 104796 / JCM 9543 / NBRC 105858 / Y-104) TaxID=479431 RepID=C8X8G7_NAKMY|nr:hypothetical protein [Nakamurella multipartita]ACV79022.1 hypothetical protein Namu_2676 [Nakamurella multipartita DSM 44233]
MSTRYLTQPRIEPGVRTGGQWTQHQHAAPGVSLAPTDAESDDPTRRTREVLRARRQRLAAEQTGYIEAAAVRAGTDPRQAGDPRSWWDTHFVTAEYGATDGDYAQMPDDFTPRRTSGRSIVGMRRTHRMAYKSADGSFAVRMPSATSIKAFERQTGTTFDVPVSAVSADGRVVSGWVRVTRSGSNWAATELGDFGPSGVEVSEAVSCVLEARRPSRALAQAGDLRRRRAEKVASNGVTVVPVPSTFIDTIAYDSSSGIMGVTIRGKTYGYQVPETSFDSVRVDRSPGRAYNKLVKGRPRMAVDKCEQCGRFTSRAATHTCPLGHRDRTGARYAHNDVARRAAARYARANRIPAGPTPPPPDRAQPDPNAAAGGTGPTPPAGDENVPVADRIARTLPPERVGDRTVTVRSGIHDGRRVVAVVLTDGTGQPADGADGTPAVQLFSVDRTPSGAVLGPLVASRHADPASTSQVSHPHGADPADTRRIDLAAMLRKARPGGRPSATTRDGATTGWSRHPEVTGSLTPYTSSRYVPHLYGNQVGNGQYGVVGFDGISGPAAGRLLAAMPEPVRATRHRSAPTTGDLLRAAETHLVEVGGYTTHPDMFGGDRLRAESAHVYDVRDGETPDQAWERVSRDYQLSGGDPAQAQVVTVPWTGRRAWRFAWS